MLIFVLVLFIILGFVGGKLLALRNVHQETVRQVEKKAVEAQRAASMCELCSLFVMPFYWLTYKVRLKFSIGQLKNSWGGVGRRQLVSSIMQYTART
ncbi:MAG: hypothetical protein GX971_11770 [Firmicutes bacterium]|nr:hypothetical protein [Bacillota bacterium]